MNKLIKKVLVGITAATMDLFVLLMLQQILQQ